jgi:LIM domain-binding protein 1
MIVGEPSLMGGEMDDEDERYITRLENTQYDPNAPPTSHPPPPPQYLSPTQQIPPPGFQQNPNLQSLLHQKQQFIPNSPLLHPSQMKREQLSFPGSPQSQQQQPLPSMFSTGGPPTPNANTNSTVFPPPSAPINGDLSTGGKRISNTLVSANPSTTNNNSSNSPPTPNHNQVLLQFSF